MGYYDNCTYKAIGVEGCYANCKGCLGCEAGKSTNMLNGSTHPSDCEVCGRIFHVCVHSDELGFPLLTHSLTHARTRCSLVLLALPQQ